MGCVRTCAAGRFLALALALGVFLASLASAQDEYQVKAAFLYNFAKFIEWPARSYAAPGDPIVICILGQNPFGDALSETVRGKVWAGRPFAVRLISELPPKSKCQIVFVPSSDRQLFRSMVASLKGGAILTIGDTPGFIDDGGIINFKLEDGKIRFDVNMEAAGQAQLSISSKLLSLAQSVKK
jgi:hypothetical protein